MKRKFKLKAWAYIINDGDDPPLVPWGAGEYWQLPIFHSRAEARRWRTHHDSYPTAVRLMRVVVCPCPNNSAQP